VCCVISELEWQAEVSGETRWESGTWVKQKRVCIACCAFSSSDSLINPDDALFNTVECIEQCEG